MLALPEDVLRQICFEIFNIDDRYAAKDLLNVMLSSKALYHIVRPILYRRLCFDSIDFPFQQLLQRFIDTPETASFVRKLDPGYWDPIKSSPLNLEQPLVDALTVAARAISVSTALRADIEVGIRAGNQDALLSLLLSMYKNLTLLVADRPCDSNDTMTMRLVREVTQEVATPSRELESLPLQRLDTLMTGCMDRKYRDDLDETIPFWGLPSLCRFRGDQMLWYQISSPPRGITSNLRYTIFGDSLISPTGLREVLILCPRLCGIDIELGDPMYDVFEFNYNDFGDVLRQYGTRLERFVLYHNEHAQCGIGDNSEEGVLGSLSGMTHLQTLYLEWEALFGQSDEETSGVSSHPTYLSGLLPPSLRKLGLRMNEISSEHTEQTDAQLLELMKIEKFKKLETIRIIRTDAFTYLEQMPPTWRQLKGDEPEAIEWDGEKFNFDDGTATYMENGGILLKRFQDTHS